MLGEAKENLGRFDAVGVVERFDESLALILERVGDADPSSPPRVPEYESRRVNPDRPALEELDDESLAALRRHNELDLELQAFACELVEERLAQRR
jgi:hypothetical protein